MSIQSGVVGFVVAIAAGGLALAAGNSPVVQGAALVSIRAPEIDRAPGPPVEFSQDIPACMIIAGVPGDLELQACPEQIALLAFQHDADQLSGAGAPGTVSIETYLGRQTPLLNELFKAQTLIASIQVNFRRITSQGLEENYFQVVLSNVLIKDVSDRLAKTSLTDNAPVAYQRFTLQPASITYVDLVHNVSSTLP